MLPKKLLGLNTAKKLFMLRKLQVLLVWILFVQQSVAQVAPQPIALPTQPIDMRYGEGQGRNSSPSAQTAPERTEKAKILLPGAQSPQELTVRIANGMAFLSDDIALMSEAQYELKKLEKGGIIVYGSYRWPNGQIPYVIASGHPNTSQITAAINTINSSTNICMVPRTTQTNYVEFVSQDPNACWSYIGMIGGRQLINVSNCGVGPTIHEICHAAGMFHEQSRNDRDTYVTVYPENILSGMEGNFEKYGATGTDIGTYDYSSIMHYGTNYFTKNGQPTITVKIPPGTSSTTIGQRSTLSAQDIATLNGMYTVKNCTITPPPPSALISLFAPITVSPNPIVSGSSFTVSTNFVNVGTDTFLGCYYVGLFNTADQLITLYPGLQESNGLGPNFRYSSNVTFNCSANGVAAGTYKIGVVYKNNCTGDYILAGNETQTNPITVAVTSGSSLSVSPSSLSFSAAGGSSSFAITSSGVNWTVTEAADWLSVNTPSGSGNASIAVTATPSPLNTGRTATITVSGAGVPSRTVSIAQSGVSATLSASPSTLSLGGSGGSATVQVSSNTAWTATASQSWVTLSSPNGSGNAALSVTASPNPSTSPRTATLTLSATGAASVSVTITQAGREPSITLSPTSLSFGSTGGTTSLNVTASVAWTLSGLPSWLSATPSTGSGNAALTFTCQANPSILARNATLTFTGSDGSTQTVSVVQSGAAPALSVSPQSLTASETGGTLSFSITSNTSWTVSESSTWLSISPASGSNNGTVTVSVSANALASPRTASISVTGQGLPSTSVTVTQNAAPPFLSASPASLQFESGAGTLSFNVTSNTNWTVGETLDWLSVSQGSGTNNGQIQVTVLENLALTPRTGSIALTAPGVAPQSVAVAQSPNTNTISVSPASLVFSSQGGNSSVALTALVNWTASTSAAWLSVAPAQGTSSTTLQVSCQENTSLNARNATVTVIGSDQVSKTINVTQNAALPFVLATPTTLSAAQSGSTFNVSITSNTTWTLQPSANWIRTDVPSGSGNQTIVVSCDENPGYGVRSATLTVFSLSAAPVVITINQAGTGQAPFLNVTPNPIVASSSGGNMEVYISSNTTWRIVEYLSWVTVRPVSGEFNDTIVLSIQPRTSTSSRSGTLTFSGAGVTSFNVNITQNGIGSGAILSVSPTSLTFPAPGGRDSVSVSSNTTWNASSTANWLRIINNTGSNSGRFSVISSPNPEVQPRTAEIRVSGVDAATQVVTVTQAGAAPLLAIRPDTLRFPFQGGRDSIRVLSNMEWSAFDTLNWVSFSPLRGEDSASAFLVCQPNPAPTARIGRIPIRGESGNTVVLTIVQGPDNTALSVSPDSLAFAAQGGNAAFAITTGNNWATSTNAPWITLSKGSGQGNDSVQVSCQPNGSPQPRSAEIVVIGQGGSPKTVKVYQAGLFVPPFLTVTPNPVIVAAVGGRITLQVSSNINWRVSESLTWLSASPASGSNNGTVTLTLQAKTTPNPRSGVITFFGTGIAAVRVTVTQYGQFTLAVSPERLEFPNSGGQREVAISSNTSWSVETPSANWLSASPASGANNGSVSLTCAPNLSTERRTAEIRISGNEVGTRTITVAQEGVLFDVSGDTLWFANTGGEDSVHVRSNVAWTVIDSLDWLHSSPENGEDSMEIEFVCRPNPDTTLRTGVVYVLGPDGFYHALTAVQAASPPPPFVALSTNTLSFDADGGSQTFVISSNTTWRISRASGTSWVSVSPLSGSRNMEITVVVSPNTRTFPRNTTLTLFSAGLPSQRIAVRQEAKLASPLGDTPLSELPPTPGVPVLRLPENAFLAFPNPGNGLFALETGSPIQGRVQVSVTDLFGRVVEQRELGTGWMPGATEYWDLSRQPEGIYLVQVRAASGWWTGKVQIVR